MEWVRKLRYNRKVTTCFYNPGLYPKRFPVEPVQRELVKQLTQVVTSAAAVAGSAVSGIIAAPGNVPRTGRYIVGTIQSLAVF